MGNRGAQNDASKQTIPWYLGFGLLWGSQFNCYSTTTLFNVTDFLRAPNDAFNIASLIAVIITSTVVAILSFRNRIPRHSLIIWIPTTAFVLGIFGISTGAFGLVPERTVLLASGVLTGTGYGMLALSWQELFASEEPSTTVLYIALGFLTGSIVCYALTYLPFAAAVAAAILLTVFSTVLLRNKRKNVAGVLRAENDTKTALQDGATGLVVAETKRNVDYRTIASEIAGPLICLLALQGVFGIVSQVAMAGPAGFIDANLLMDLGMTVAAILFLIIAILSSKSPNPIAIYKILFPIVGGALLLLPFLGDWYSVVLSAFIVVASSLVLIAFNFLIAEVAYRTSIKSNVLAGATNALTQCFVLFGVVVGVSLVGRGVVDFVRLTSVAFASVYILTMVILFFARRNSRPIQTTVVVNEVIEKTADEERAEKIKAIAEQYGLTKREAEILDFLSRGRSSTYIGETLVLSQNTVRSHIKSVYSKTGIHTRQDLLDLIETTKTE